MSQVVCDPFWSDSNGYCSDDQGLPLTQSGQRVPYSEVLRNLFGVEPEPAVEPKKAVEKKEAGFDPGKWLGTGYNALYVAIAFVMLLMLLSASRGRR